MENDVIIDHKEISDEFLDHLKINDNKRILFSAPFGTGKSTFLKNFFENDENFISVSLYPVNYSVSANEDVFELIKFDLLLELLSKYGEDVEISKEEFTLLFTSQYFIYDKIRSQGLLSSIVSLGEKIGKPVFKFLKIFDDTIKDVKAFKTKMEDDENKAITSYLKESLKRQGSIYEMDDISFLIFNLIKRLVEKRSSEDNVPETVLIIDDLDRLDPDHIFRLFNIFSSHYDHISDKNKFGFTKVVFVCDIENVRKIYHHKYGPSVDFSGYLDKFYSKEVFSFDNVKYIKENIKRLLGRYTPESGRHRLNVEESTFYYGFSWLLSTFLEAKEFNLRMLVQKSKLKLPNYTFQVGESYIDYHAKNYDFLVMIFYFKSFFATYEVLEEKLKRVSELYKKNYNPLVKYNSTYFDLQMAERSILGMLFPFFINVEDGFVSDRASATPKRYDSKELDVSIYYEYEVPEYIRMNMPYVRKITRFGNANDSAEVRLNLFQMLYLTYKKCRNEGFLK